MLVTFKNVISTSVAGCVSLIEVIVTITDTMLFVSFTGGNSTVTVSIVIFEDGKTIMFTMVSFVPSIVPVIVCVPFLVSFVTIINTVVVVAIGIVLVVIVVVVVVEVVVEVLGVFLDVVVGTSIVVGI